MNVVLSIIAIAGLAFAAWKFIGYGREHREYVAQRDARLRALREIAVLHGRHIEIINMKSRGVHGQFIAEAIADLDRDIDNNRNPTGDPN